jgi:hypothetical protein
MAAVAASQAAIASTEAHRAHVERCKATMPNFDAQRATVAEMREYSGCVDALYPSELGTDATIALKVLFVIALAGLVGGAWWERRNSIWCGWGEALMMGGLWFVMAPCIVAFAAGILYGIRWLFT